MLEFHPLVVPCLKYDYLKSVADTDVSDIFNWHVMRSVCVSSHVWLTPL